MVTLLRLALIGVLTLGCLSGLTCAAWLTAERWGLPALVGELGGEMKRAQQLEATRAGTLRRVEEQRRVAQEVTAGRLPLLPAAARIRAIRADEPPAFRKLARRHHPGTSEEEWLCLVVIDFVVGELGEGSQRARVLEARLLGELRRHQRRGPLRLPH
jgi:hypothetical protein